MSIQFCHSLLGLGFLRLKWLPKLQSTIKISVWSNSSCGFSSELRTGFMILWPRPKSSQYQASKSGCISRQLEYQKRKQKLLRNPTHNFRIEKSGMLSRKPRMKAEKSVEPTKRTGRPLSLSELGCATKKGISRDREKKMKQIEKMCPNSRLFSNTSFFFNKRIGVYPEYWN